MDGANESNSSPVNRSKFFIGGFLIVAAIIYLIVSSTKANAQYFLTVDEVYEK
ncbi:MAG TPA: cytochrome c maturation protein CcmE, partial [Anaerolineae bacterium]|nr:cytochrome c maturation protein CcmE [Anaerolineae bacterium]